MSLLLATASPNLTIRAVLREDSVRVQRYR